jgi:hypothetical protein
MAHGVRTPEDKEREFRKHYLVTGNVAGSAKAVGLPVNTGYELRDRALDDPSFVRLRDRIRAKLEPDAEQMAVCAMQLCMERLNKDPDERLDRMLAASGEGGKVTFQDPGPQYAASLAKLIQAVIGTRRFEAERTGDLQPPGTVRIVVSGPDGVKLGDGDDGASA